MRVIILFFCILLFPSIAFANNPDLSINPEDIRFSVDTLIVGQTVRLYARIQNVGDEDVSGYATFFQGNAVLGNSQVISVLANGAPEEVYIDFIVPASTFNIRAELRGTAPEDINLSNNTAITSLLTPVFDADGDQVEDPKDNCQNLANQNQLDSDQDGAGDVCDSDDDNDGLSDEVEQELATDPTQPDSDEDGTVDSNDAFPLDPKKQQHEPETPLIKQVIEQLKNKTAESANLLASSALELPAFADLSEPVPKQDADTAMKEVMQFSPNAVFFYQQSSWNTFIFRVAGIVDENYYYEWDFGDGVRSGKTEATHTYAQSGAYPVMLTIQDEEGRSSTDRATVFVPFFSLQNKLVLLLIGVLSLLLGLALWLTLRKKHV